jgi:hypothetical protein
MTQRPKIPDAATRKHEVEKLRACSRQLENFTSDLEALIAVVEADLQKQYLTRRADKP